VRRHAVLDLENCNCREKSNCASGLTRNWLVGCGVARNQGGLGGVQWPFNLFKSAK